MPFARAQMDRIDQKVLKQKAVAAALQGDEDLCLNTRNPRHVWHAYQLARTMQATIPGWVLRYLDKIAKREIAVRSRNTDTAERYEAALTQMEVAVDAHRSRLAIRKVGKQLGVEVEISRRDRPNLRPIARAAAKAHRVSVNRLLAAYRRSPHGRDLTRYLRSR